MNYYNDATEEAFFLLTELLSGNKIESRDFGFNASADTKFGSNITLDSTEKSDMIKVDLSENYPNIL